MLRDIKKRLIDLGKTQRWLVKQLNKRGFPTLRENAFSAIINGSYSRGYAQQVLDLADEILAEQAGKEIEDHANT